MTSGLNCSQMWRSKLFRSKQVHHLQPTNEMGEEVCEREVGQEDVGRGLHVLVLGDHHDGHRVAEHAHGEDDGVERADRHDRREGEVRRAEVLREVEGDVHGVREVDQPGGEHVRVGCALVVVGGVVLVVCRVGGEVVEDGFLRQDFGHVMYLSAGCLFSECQPGISEGGMFLLGWPGQRCFVCVLRTHLTHVQEKAMNEFSVIL